MRRSVLAVALIALFAFVQPASAREESRVVVENLSDWIIEEFYMSPTDVDDWGEDLLGDEILEPGDSLTLTHITCDDWDILVVDEDEDECILEEVDLCGDHATWELTSRELVGCISDTEER